MFCRARPEYADRRVAVALAQGAALHYLDGRNGVKDLIPIVCKLEQAQSVAHHGPVEGAHVPCRVPMATATAAGVQCPCAPCSPAR